MRSRVRRVKSPDADVVEERTYWQDLRALLECPRELWLTYAALIFEYVGLYSFMSVLSLWLTHDFGFDDNRASNWFGVFAALLSLFAFLVGAIADVVGTRRTLIFSFGAAMLTRSLMSVSHTAAVALPALVAYSFALASGSPVLQTAIHKYSNKRTVSIAFSFFYIALNIGGVLAGQVIDRTKAFFADPVTHKLMDRVVNLPLAGPTNMSAYRAIIGVGTLTAAVAFLATLFVRSDKDLVRKDLTETERDEAREDAGAKKKSNPLALLRDVIADKRFWRFMLLMGFLVLVKATFVHMHSTWPKFITRERGEDFDWGWIWGLNSVLILVFVPIVTAFTRKLAAYTVISIGSVITALSPFVFALGASTSIQIAGVVVLTVGEALWSPRSYEYNVSIAPKGREATYVSLAVLPYFVAKFFVAMIAGRLLTAYCPAEGPRNSAMLWIIVGLITIIGPVGILGLKKIIHPKAPPESPVPAAAS
jgi:dipeptide/tripeptide permease